MKEPLDLVHALFITVSSSHGQFYQNLDEKIDSSKRVSWRKEAFIDMLHHIKVSA